MTRLRSLLLLALTCVVVSAQADDLQIDVHAVEGELRIDLRAQDVLDDDVERALRSGLPARVRLTVELWNASGWLDRFVLDHRSEHRVLFDLLDERYDVIDDRGEVVFRSTRRREIEDWIERLDDLPLCFLDDLETDDGYYVAVEFRVEPLTLEEVRDLERWLRGNLSADADESMLSRVSRQLFGVLKGRVGLGDREVRGRSKRFEPGALRD